MSHFVDLHNHLLFKMDDGAASMKETAQMLLAAEKDGIRKLIATPHAQPGKHAFDYAGYLDKLRYVNEFCMAKGLQVVVYPGAEILYSESALRQLDDKLIPTLADGRHILVEFHTDVEFMQVFHAVRGLSNAGYVPVLAHIERYECLVREPEQIAEIRSQLNVRMQMNCSTIIRHQGLRMGRFVKRVLADRLIDYVATDAHNTTSRPICMLACYKKLEKRYGKEYASALTLRNQAEIFW